MPGDIYVKLSELETVEAQLTAIVTEFENAASNSEALEAAIANPYRRSELREQAKEFEERWEDKREQLTEALAGIRNHVKGVIDEIENWDSETAIGLTPEE